MKIPKLKNLINSQTNQPFEIKVEEKDLPLFRKISKAAYRSGKRFQQGLREAGVIK